jgi:hypothetical protein
MLLLLGLKKQSQYDIPSNLYQSLTIGNARGTRLSLRYYAATMDTMQQYAGKDLLLLVGQSILSFNLEIRKYYSESASIHETR